VARPGGGRGRAAAAAATGVGFTLALLIAGRAFTGGLLDEARTGILATVLIAPSLSLAAAHLRRLPGAGRRDLCLAAGTAAR
jgi:Na+/H+ antiporter NhaA